MRTILGAVARRHASFVEGSQLALGRGRPREAGNDAALKSGFAARGYRGGGVRVSTPPVPYLASARCMQRLRSAASAMRLQSDCAHSRALVSTWAGVQPEMVKRTARRVEIFIAEW